jgi:putative transposase
MTTGWCVEVLQQALAMHGKPEIFNTDQGSQFTSEMFINTLKSNNIAISMDGKGRALDNIFIERLWRTVKYENIYLNVYENGVDLYKGLSKYFEFYNSVRKHQSLNYETPIRVFRRVA